MIRSEPLYFMKHGIAVYHENFTTVYVMCRVKAPRRLFPRTKPDKNGQVYVQRSRVVMTSILGRALKRNEHVHHGRAGKHVDTKKNLTLITSSDHNRHHKTGFRHSPEVKEKIAASMRKSHASGSHEHIDFRGKKNPFYGRCHSAATKAKISAAKRRK